MVAKRRKTNTEYLKNANGVWINDDATLKHMARDFYLNLYVGDSFTFVRFPVLNAFPKLNEMAIR